METMITVERAIELIKEQVMPLNAVNMRLKEAGGLVLAKDILAPIAIPAFPQSSMDGYAFAFDPNLASYQLVGAIAAGDSSKIILEKGKAVRIFTGAAVPKGADTVLMQEKAKVENKVLTILQEDLKEGDNYRSVGSEIQKDTIAVSKETLLNPATIGFLANIGIAEVHVYPRPKVGIMVTGNELQIPGSALEYGQVYESNSYTLLTALEQIYIQEVKVISAPDDLGILSAKLNVLLENNDIVFMTGGVSVGDYDFTLKAFEANGVVPIFHKIKQKPGKPLLFGKKGDKLVFGLPGNPASVLTCYYEYLLPAIGFMMSKDLTLKKKKVPIGHDFVKSSGLKQFMKALYNGENIMLQSGQESYKLASYAGANCLAVLPEDCKALSKGDIIEIHLIPDSI
jgi:molybdopterin molybdotransferase